MNRKVKRRYNYYSAPS